jgi:histidinol-phosphate phosphatase family protein
MQPISGRNPDFGGVVARLLLLISAEILTAPGRVFPHLTGLPTGAVDSTWTIMVDRDGVVNRRIVGSYVRSVAEFEILPGAVQALVDLSAAAGRVVLVTNQAGLGKRLMTVSDLDLIHRSLLDAVARRGGHIDGVFYCPHLREDNCPCRKPGTGLADQAVRTFPEISLSRTVVIGDSSSDMEFADRLGVPSVFIGSPVRWDGRPGNIVAADLSAAARLLIGCRSNRR